jgi:hypothetical protein
MCAHFLGIGGKTRFGGGVGCTWGLILTSFGTTVSFLRANCACAVAFTGFQVWSVFVLCGPLSFGHIAFYVSKGVGNDCN